VASSVLRRHGEIITPTYFERFVLLARLPHFEWLNSHLIPLFAARTRSGWAARWISACEFSLRARPSILSLRGEMDASLRSQ
jgi:hypothetical protein